MARREGNFYVVVLHAAKWLLPTANPSNMSRVPIGRESNHQLLVRFFELLSMSEQSSDLVKQILCETGRHFGFGCGFVYEADHTGTFFLNESFTNYDVSLNEPFLLEERLGREEIKAFFKEPFFIRNRPESAVDHRNDRQLFASNTYVMAPVLDGHNHLVALVGMADRRLHQHLSEDTLITAEMILGLVATQVKLRVLQRRLDDARQSLGSVLDNLGVDVYVNDFHTHEILYANQSMAVPYGGLENMLGKKCWQALYEDKTGPCDFCPQPKLVDENGEPTKIYSWDYQRPFDGSWFRVLSGSFRWLDGRLAHVVSSVDITENKKNEAIIARLALYDPLTNLPNRRKLMDDADRLINEACATGRSGYMAFIDFDDFKRINDLEGHPVGDSFLVDVSQILLDSPLIAEHSYRYGGDEFVFFFPNVEKAAVITVLRQLLARFSERRFYNGNAYVCSASMGLAKFPDDGLTAEKVLGVADQMMYRAKSKGKGIACFSDGEIVA